MADWTVDQSGGGDSVTINGAVALAASGDTITILRGEYKEQIADIGKNLIFIGIGFVLVQGSGVLAKGFTLTGNSIVTEVEITDFTTSGVDGGFSVSDCYITDCAKGIVDAEQVYSCNLLNNTIGAEGIDSVRYCTVSKSTSALVDCDYSEGVVFVDCTTCHKFTATAMFVRNSVFDTIEVSTNYGAVGVDNYISLSAFHAIFGSESGFEQDVRFFDRDIEAYWSSTDNRLTSSVNYSQAGYPLIYTGISAEINHTLFSEGVFTGSTAFDGTKISGAGTASTNIFDLKVSRQINQFGLITIEDITSGDKIETTSDMLDIEYRGSNTPFLKDNGVIAWQTIEREKGQFSAYRYWQFRFTIVGSAELLAIILALGNRATGMNPPEWSNPANVGIDSISVNIKNGIDFTFYAAALADVKWRLYGQHNTSVGLFSDSNHIGDFVNSNVAVAQLANGSRFVNGETYYFGARLVFEGSEESNEISTAYLFNFTPSPPDIPDIAGEYLGSGSIKIELIDAPVLDPNYYHTTIYEETVNGFTKEVGNLINNGESLQLDGYMINSVFIFIAVAVGYDGQRSYASEEVRIATVDEVEADHEMIYT